MSKVTTANKGAPQTKKTAAPTGKKTQKNVKPPLSTEERQKRCFASLCDQLDGDHLENAIRTTNKLLALDPTDEDALKTKLFLLLKTNRYNEALKMTEQGGGGDQFIFERAYALYKLQREKEAQELLHNSDDRAVLFLQAQIHYRLGEYADALDKYNTLLSSSSPSLDEYQDIQTNILATETNLSFLQSGFLTSIHQLPPLPRGQTLEDTPLPPLHAHTSLQDVTNAAVSTQDANDKAIEAKQNPPRKSRVPKGVIPGVTPPPDPERWIKKSERTKVEGHGKKKKGGGGATQGSTGTEQTGKKKKK